MCPGGPLPLIEHEQLKICDTFANIGEAVPHLAENNAFPLGTIFVTKSRLALTCQLTFKLVSQKKSGHIYLKDDIPVKKIEGLVNWNRVSQILDQRNDYEERVREIRRFAEDYSSAAVTEQLDLSAIEP